MLNILWFCRLYRTGYSRVVCIERLSTERAQGNRWRSSCVRRETKLWSHQVRFWTRYQGDTLISLGLCSLSLLKSITEQMKTLLIPFQTGSSPTKISSKKPNYYRNLVCIVTTKCLLFSWWNAFTRVWKSFCFFLSQWFKVQKHLYIVPSITVWNMNAR